MKKTQSLSTLFCLTALLPTLAQETIVTLAPTTVTAERLGEEEGEETQGSITNEDLTKRSATDLNDIFQKTPSITVSGGRNQAQQIHINGLESNLSNVTIDGAKQGNIYHHAGTVFVEPELLKQVGIDAGAGNALQGLGALNGTLRFETKNAFDLLPEDQTFASLTKGLYYSNGEGYRASQSLAFRLSDNWAFLLSGSKSDRDAYKDGNGDVVELTDYTSENYLLKFSGQFETGHSLDFAYESVLTDTVAFDRFNITEDFLNSTGRPPGLLQRNELGRESFTFNYGFTSDTNDYVDLKATASVSQQEYRRLTSGENSELESVGFSIRNTSRFAENFKSTYGFDYQQFDNNAFNVGISPNRVNESETAYGFFLQNDWQLHEMASLSFGARYDTYDFDSIAGNNFKSSEFSPNVMLTVNPIDDLTLTASYAKAFRGVGIREGFLPGDRPAELDGEGEESETFKLTARYERDGLFVSGSCFDQSIDNYLYPIATGRGGPNGSFGDITNHGYEFRVGYQKNGFATSLAVSDSSPNVSGYAYTDDLGIVVAGRRWILDTSYNHEDSGVTLGANIEHRESVDEVALAGPFPAVSGKDSYTLVNAYLNWEVNQIEDLTISLNVDNLFDEQYQDHTIYTASGFASPGREVRLGASYKF